MTKPPNNEKEKLLLIAVLALALAVIKGCS